MSSRRAQRAGVARFVFISTDKGGRPTNVMGATQADRRADRRCRERTQRQSPCASVRFGNVLASSGSVVPKFVAQIKAGGPVTGDAPGGDALLHAHSGGGRARAAGGEQRRGAAWSSCSIWGSPCVSRRWRRTSIPPLARVTRLGLPIVYRGTRGREKLHEELFLGDIERATRFKYMSVGRVQPTEKVAFEQALTHPLFCFLPNAETGLPPNYAHISPLRNWSPSMWTGSGIPRFPNNLFYLQKVFRLSTSALLVC